MRHPIKIGVLISGGGSNLQAIFEACQARKIDARVAFVGSDNPEASGLEQAIRRGVPTFVVDYKVIQAQYGQRRQQMALAADCNWERLLQLQRLLPADTPHEALETFFIPRLVAEARLLAHLRQEPFDLLVLAGFMRTLTPYFIDGVNPDPHQPRIMNIHPALLPAFPGVDGYGDTFRYGCRVGGCTVHFVDYGEDTGPIIDQRAFRIDPGDSLETVRQRGLALEWELYPECIRLFAENRLRVVTKAYSLCGVSVVSRRVVEIVPG